MSADTKAIRERWKHATVSSNPRDYADSLRDIPPLCDALDDTNALLRYTMAWLDKETLAEFKNDALGAEIFARAVLAQGEAS